MADRSVLGPPKWKGYAAWEAQVHAQAPNVKIKPPTSSVNAPTNSPIRTIQFFGQDFFNSSDWNSFIVLCGDQPPTITGGYAKWTTIDLPLRRGLTSFQGYDPVIMEMTVRFIEFNKHGSWLTDNATGQLVEEKIHRLEWMAGESFESGPPPRVTLSTFDGAGKTVGLIPLWYQSEVKTVPGLVGAANVGPWFVLGLDWDKAPIRNDDGWRVHQKATVTMQLYQGQNSQTTGLTRPKSTVFTARAGADSALLIARQEPTAFPQQLAIAIMNAPQNKGLHLRSVNQKIKPGKQVRVPSGN